MKKKIEEFAACVHTLPGYRASYRILSSRKLICIMTSSEWNVSQKGNRCTAVTPEVDRGRRGAGGHAWARARAGGGAWEDISR